jgi:hypothetical protein
MSIGFLLCEVDKLSYFDCRHYFVSIYMYKLRIFGLCEDICQAPSPTETMTHCNPERPYDLKSQATPNGRSIDPHLFAIVMNAKSPATAGMCTSLEPHHRVSE